MMKLVYKLQAEDYKFDFPVSSLPVSKLRWGELGQGRGPCPVAAVGWVGRSGGL